MERAAEGKAECVWSCAQVLLREEGKMWAEGLHALAVEGCPGGHCRPS